MAFSKLPPLPVGVAPGSVYMNDWYEKLRTLINSLGTSISWGLITGTPTTLSGYGITDAYTKSEITTNYYTKTDITGSYYNKTYIDANFYTQAYIGTNYYTKTSTDTLLNAKQNTSAKDAASGYAGLNSVSRITKGVDTSDDIITDSTAKGPVMKSPNGHYWRATISNLGVVTWTDLGTTKP